MQKMALILVLLLNGCSQQWHDEPYQVYWIDGVRTLGFDVGDGSFIDRVREVRLIKANDNFISVYACPDTACAYYYVDRTHDHKFADSTEFVFGPFAQDTFISLQRELSLPQLVKD